MGQKQKKNIGAIDTNYLTMDKNNYKMYRGRTLELKHTAKEFVDNIYFGAFHSKNISQI